MFELPRHASTVVIGAGTGGCAFASTIAELSEEPVLLLEAGPDYGKRASGEWPADILSAKSIPLSHDWNLLGVGSEGAMVDLPRARVVGGCSSHNGCTISLGAGEDYDDWSRRGNQGWEAETVEPLLAWAHDRFRVRRYRMDELTTAQAAFVRAGMASGLPFADDLDSLEAGPGIGPMPVNIVDGVRWNASFAFLDAARDRANLEVVGGVHLQRLLFSRDHVTGVRVIDADGYPHTITSQRVVVAGGAYHSPAILLRSGVGDPQALRALSIEPVVDLPGVGKNLLDHACVQLDFNGKAGLLEELARMEWNPDEQTVGRARSSLCDDGPYDIHVFMVAGANSGHPGLPPITLYGGAMRAVSQGTVTLASENANVEPLVDHRYGTDPDGHDRAVLTEALGLLREMSHESELAALLGDRVNTGHDPLVTIASYCHPAGTCKMGPDTDSTAVVDTTGRVHGTHGLYLADASIMPSISRGNINLPTAMIGARVAAGLLDLSPQTVAASLR
jgi:choline dehydrogenase